MFPIASFPKDDDNILYIESQGGLAILFTVRDPALVRAANHCLSLVKRRSRTDMSPVIWVGSLIRNSVNGVQVSEVKN